MHLESNGEVNAVALSDAQIDALNRRKASERNSAPFPWEELEEHLQDLRVAEQMGKGATTEDARALPLLTYNEMLMLRAAEIEATPARMEKARQDAALKEQGRQNAEASKGR